MIHYALRCDAGHEFEGWFRGSAAFDDQVARGLLACPACGSAAVRRALMAPAVARGRGMAVEPDGTPVPQAAPAVAPPAPAPPPAAQAAAALPDAVRAVLQRLRAEVESRCENVGDRFADEARRIHAGESAARGIYGDATAEEAEALREDGIDVARLPWVPRADG